MAPFTSLVGGIEYRERPPAYRGQPKYKRIDFVRSKTDKHEDYDLVKTIYKTPKKKSSSSRGSSSSSTSSVEDEDGPPRLTIQQWDALHQHRMQQQRQRDEAARQQQMRAQQEARMRQEFEMRQRAMWEQQQREQQQQQQHHHHQQQHQAQNQQRPPPPPMHHPQQQGGRGFAEPMRLDNRHGPGIHDVIQVMPNSDSEDEDRPYEVQHIRPRAGGRHQVRQDDVYSDSDYEPPRRTGHRYHR